MAAESIHTFTGNLLARHMYTINGITARKAKQEIALKHHQAAIKDYSYYRIQPGLIKQHESQHFHLEPALFSAYRVKDTFNPCDQIDEKIKLSLEQNQNHVKNLCLGNSNPYATIKYPGHAWSSEDAIQDGFVSMFTQCAPNNNSRALYMKHMVANAYDVSVDRLCRAAWSGFKEAWSELKYCQSRAGWVDLNSWAGGEIKRVPAQK